MNADKLWFKLNTTAASYVWGTGAGPLLNHTGYSANNFYDNP